MPDSQFPAVSETASASQQTTALLKLRELLLRGEFQPGERMREIPLAQRLGVSRTPLRLAFTAMQHEGLLDLHPRRGFVVRAFTRRDVEHAIEIRGLLEAMAARLLAQRLIDRQPEALTLLDTLRTNAAELDEVIARLDLDPQAALRDYILHNRSFHALLLEGACSEVLRRQFDRVVTLPFAAPSSGFLHTLADLAATRSILRIGQDQHHAIVAALADRDAFRVESLLREHARLSLRNLELALANQSAAPPGGVPIL